MTLLWLPPAAVQAFCETLSITDHTTGAAAPWRLNTEQRHILQHLSTGRWVFAAKPRQVGMTTLVQADDILWCWLNDGAGNRVRAALYVDSEKKLKERQAFAESVMRQRPKMFKGCDINSERMLFKNGSVLEFSTGSGKAEGRSGTLQRLHLSELPFWQNPGTYGALMPSIGQQQCIIETTLDVDAPCGPLVRDLWRGKNSYTRVFFCLEDHDEYRADPASIDDDMWAKAQEQGFTRRDAAAWWLTVGLNDICAGDMQRLMREFPQQEGHMFAADAGRYIKVTPSTRLPMRVIDEDGYTIEVYKPLTETCGQVMIACDVAAGKERDASAIAVVDKLSREMVACLRDNSIEAPALARAIKRCREEYTLRSPPMFTGADPPSPTVPTCVVEVQGLGHGVASACREIGVGVVEQAVSGAEGSAIIAEVLRRSKEAIKSGALRGPAELATECDQLRRDPVTGRWKGSKDLLVAYGHADRWCDLQPYETPKQAAPRHDVVRAADFLSRGHKSSAWD